MNYTKYEIKKIEIKKIYNFNSKLSITKKSHFFQNKLRRYINKFI